MLNNKKNESIKPTEDMINNDEKISEPKDESADNKAQKSKKPRKILSSQTTVIIILSVVILLTAASCIFLFFKVNNLNKSSSISVISQPEMGPQNNNHQVIIQRAVSTDDSSTKTALSGVVISVSDNSFVIAGNGEQTTIKTTNDTTYNVSDDKVEVNDSVTVFGTKSDSTITATDIRVMNL